MKISIITVVYNNEKTIAQAIESVLSQQYEHIEYIIVDGSSTDNTLNIVRQYESQISKIISEPDGGIYDAMNKGIKISTGDVIGILNSDDLYAHKDVLKQVAEQFSLDKDLDILYGNLVYVKADDTDKVVRKWNSSPFYDNYFERGHVPPHPTVFLRKKIYDEAGLFDTKYKLAADYEFLLRIFKKHHYKSKYLDLLMVRMRMGGATNKNFKNIFNGNKEIIAAWKDNSISMPRFLMINRLFKRLIQFF